MGATFGEWVATMNRHTRDIEVSRAQVEPGVASDTAGQILFDGVLYNADDLRRELDIPDNAAPSDADLVLAAFRRHGRDVVHHLRGQWLLIARDRSSGEIICARDHYGQYGCYYAERNGTLLVSPSVEALARHPDVPSDINRAALVDHLRHRWPVLDETYYEAIRRVPGGYVMTYENGSREVNRYWRPLREIDESLTPDETQARFDQLLERAVERCLFAPTAIYLSGGLDSVSVAAFAAEIAAKRGQSRPYALSLVFDFEDESANEETSQLAVARQLEFEQTIVPISRAVPPTGLLQAAMEMSSTQPGPMLNLWSPAYRYLAIDGQRRGRGVILTGNGGDEWLEYPVIEGERLIRRGDVVGLYRAWRSLQRGSRLSKREITRHLFWTFGASPIVRGAGKKVLHGVVSPELVSARRARRIAAETGGWLADDPALRAGILQRYEQAASRPRDALDSPHTARDFEESFERARALGLHMAHPLWDVDLTAFLERLPPQALIRGGRSKALVRWSLAHRFPDLGFDTHRKVGATTVYQSVVLGEGPDAWRRVGGAKGLVALGIADEAKIERRVQQLMLGREPWMAYWVWYVLTIEAWLRPRL
jgi:asparagine synthase (glutamine-hydrolysing)